nr:hypothetical protein Iba_chr01cCG10890 [Ipomoea batatas]
MTSSVIPPSAKAFLPAIHTEKRRSRHQGFRSRPEFSSSAATSATGRSTATSTAGPFHRPPTCKPPRAMYRAERRQKKPPLLTKKKKKKKWENPENGNRNRGGMEGTQIGNWESWRGFSKKCNELSQETLGFGEMVEIVMRKVISSQHRVTQEEEI